MECIACRHKRNAQARCDYSNAVSAVWKVQAVYIDVWNLKLRSSFEFRTVIVPWKTWRWTCLGEPSHTANEVLASFSNICKYRSTSRGRCFERTSAWCFVLSWWFLFMFRGTVSPSVMGERFKESGSFGRPSRSWYVEPYGPEYVSARLSGWTRRWTCLTRWRSNRFVKPSLPKCRFAKYSFRSVNS